MPVLVAGSTGRALLGWDVRPRDVDLEVDGPHAAHAGEALGAPLHREAGAGWSSLRARVVIDGVEVDCSAAVAVVGPVLALAPDAAQWAAAVDVRLAGVAIRVAPPEEMLARALAAGDWGRAARIAAGAPAGRPVDAAYVARRLAAASAAR
ncbi:MAG: hypothetical protein MUE51_14210 [Thermoleophilia bacterium]|nr:hypothetical protein [Thermoleophilia bacterium]